MKHMTRNHQLLRVLITGAGGQLGQALQATLLPFVKIQALKHEQLDISKQVQVAQRIQEFKPQLIINAAAYNAVDLAEKEPLQAYAVNADGVEYLAQEANKIACPVIHISTDYVFDGTLKRAYKESDVPQPVNVYGLSKLAGERVLQQQCKESMVVRVSSLFGGKENNFAERILQRAQEKNEQQNELQVVDDQFSCPTPVNALAHALWMLVERYAAKAELPWGIWHFAGTPACSRYEWAHYIIEQAKSMGLLTHDVCVVAAKTKPVAAFAGTARRPGNTVLDCSKWVSKFDVPPPDWKKGALLSLTMRTS